MKTVLQHGRLVVSLHVLMEITTQEAARFKAARIPAQIADRGLITAVALHVRDLRAQALLPVADHQEQIQGDDNKL